jgi:hypothetical protein
MAPPTTSPTSPAPQRSYTLSGHGLASERLGWWRDLDATIVLLGAGASKEAGVPTTAEMTEHPEEGRPRAGELEHRSQLVRCPPEPLRGLHVFSLA